MKIPKKKYSRETLEALKLSIVDWFCKRVPGFYPVRKQFVIRYGLYKGEIYEYVIATNGEIEIDIASYANKPDLT